MSLIDDLKSDVTEALKSGDTEKAETLRGLAASIHNEEIARRSKEGEGELHYEDALAVLRREAKKRKEAADIYRDAGREDLEGKESRELKIIEFYLPPPLDQAKVEKIVEKVISTVGDNYGRVMGAVMKDVDGRADAKLVTEIVKKHLGGGE